MLPCFTPMVLRMPSPAFDAKPFLAVLCLITERNDHKMVKNLNKVLAVALMLFVCVCIMQLLFFAAPHVEDYGVGTQAATVSQEMSVIVAR
jgi:hypothetical protein